MSGDTYPHWIFDSSPIPDPLGYGAEAIEFLRRLKHPKSNLPRGAFQVDPWVERVVMATYGPRHLADDPANDVRKGDRIVKQLPLLLPRGSRKTSLSAALALLHVIGPEAIPNGEVLFAAGDRNQAGIGFREAAGIVRVDQRLSSRIRVYDAHNSVKRLLYPDTGAFLEAISADARLQHGRTPQFVLADEIHVWPDRDLWEALTTGLEKSRNSLLVIATTAGRGQENVAWDVIDRARKIARGEIVDPSVLPVLFETDKDADWKDEAVWHRANPGLQHGYPSLTGFRAHAKRAEDSLAERESFLQLKLNVWSDASASPFVDMRIFDEGRELIDLDTLEGQPCWLGVDLSSNHDLTVIVAAWRDGDGGFIVHPWFFCPKDNLARRSKGDGVPYEQWAQQGFITPTPGNVVDFDAVESTIRAICERFPVREIAFDPHMGRVMMAKLNGDGYPVVEFRQGWVSMAPAIKELERAIIGRKFRHGGHPVLRWNFDNVHIERDKAENISFHKGRSKDRIDGAVATAMAVARAAAESGSRSIFDCDVTLDDLVF